MQEIFASFTRRPFVPKTGTPINLHTLCGHKDLRLATLGLGSMVKFCDQPIHVILHEDGTLTEEDVAAFQAVIPDSRIIFKRDADGPVNEALAKYPACRQLRDSLVLSIKMFDTHILDTDSEEFSYSDSDIVLLRPVTGLFKWPSDPSVGAIFMKDHMQCYSLSSWQLLANRKFKLADRLNSGIFHFKRSAFDWDLMEWFAGQEQYHRAHPYWKEQTLWAALAASTNCHAWDEKYVRVITKNADLTPDTTLAHYVSTYRDLMKYLPAREDHMVERPLFRIPTAPFSRCDWSTYPIGLGARIVKGAGRKLAAAARA